MQQDTETKPDIWFVYDGECPVCQLGASLFRVRQAVGTLHLLDARANKDHPLIQEINAARLDLDRGMVIKYMDKLYHGEGALNLMAKIGSEEGVFNRVNSTLFQSMTMSKLCYPSMRFAREVALALKGVGKIRNLEQ